MRRGSRCDGHDESARRWEPLPRGPFAAIIHAAMVAEFASHVDIATTCEGMDPCS